MKRVKLILLLGSVLAVAAFAKVKTFDGDPQPPCFPGQICN
jgi:hypothetical protein